MFKLTLLALGLAAAAPAVAAPAQTKRDSSSGSATFYSAGLGACGWTNSDTDMIVAVNSAQYDNGGHCVRFKDSWSLEDSTDSQGKWLTIKNNQNGNTISAYAADECPTCDWGSLDLSPQVFGSLNGWNYDEGMFPISWWWNE